MQVEHITSLIGDVYDAALNPNAWPEVLAKSVQFVGGSAAALFFKDASRKTGDVFYDDGGIAPDYKKSYFNKYIKLDPTTTGHYFAEIERPVSTTDILPYDEYLTTRFYKEWAKPQRIVDFLSVALEKSTTGAALLGVFRREDDGMVDDDARRRMQLLGPHIRRAVLIARMMDHKGAEAATFADTLDGLSAGMVLVDQTARIVHSNAKGHAMLASGTPLRATNGKLTAGDSRTQQVLSEIFTMAGDSDKALGTKGIAVPLSDHAGGQFVAHVLPLTSGTRRQTGKSYAAVAALFIRKAELASAAPPEVIAKLYKLTPSELRVLLAIVQVGGVPETAETLGVAEATVKTHLHRLFSKTGTARQADLVKLVASYSSPLVS
ncbi:helix-turn-helix transcriptional regulator [Leptospira interrogans]